jgi:alkylation response protein AidB-like acyl-CoA dehydrogenase
MLMPTMFTYGRPDQLERYARPALHGEHIWCQLFSEPAGGSDLAALRTRAVRDGDDWIINGQKIWTSGAHRADFGMLVTRTDPTVAKHAGLTVFLVDMKAPGVDIRPIRQISGSRHFNEVFFTDVRISDKQRLGEVGQGWRVALSTLMNERLTVGDVVFRPDLDDLIDLARTITIDGRPAIQDGAVRANIADWYVRAQGLKFTQFRTLTAMSKGRDPGPENSIGKLIKGSMAQDIASFGMDILDMAGAVMEPDLVPLHAMYQESLLISPAGRIAGGTDEILRNIIAERVLGMPGDIRVDKDKPFNEIPTGRT